MATAMQRRLCRPLLKKHKKHSNRNLVTPKVTHTHTHTHDTRPPEGRQSFLHHPSKAPAGSNEPKKYFGRSDHVVALSQLGPLRSRNGIEPAWNSIIRQVLANNFGISLLRSPRSALYPGKGYVRQILVQRVHRGHSAGSPARQPK